MTQTMTARLSGKDQETMTVEGINIDGFFVHRKIVLQERTNGYQPPWTVSLASEGQNLGAMFTKKSDAVGFAKAMAANYDGNVSAEGLIAQFRSRGLKPSCADLAEQFHMHGV